MQLSFQDPLSSQLLKSGPSCLDNLRLPQMVADSHECFTFRNEEIIAFRKMAENYAMQFWMDDLLECFGSLII